MKKGSGASVLGRHNWKRRWFVLSGNVLLYYKTDKHAVTEILKPLGTIPLLSCQIIEIEKAGHPYYFEIRPPHEEVVAAGARIFYIKAESKESLDTWLSKLYLAASGISK
jgi:hypothetical protein